MRLAAKRNEKSAPFRLAKIPKGVCANCVVTQFLYNTYPLNQQIDEAGPDLLLKPLIGDAFLMSGILDDCDMKVDEIDWRLVVKNWALPVKITKSAQNCYRMGEAAERKKLQEEYERADEAFEDGIAEALGGGDAEREKSIREQSRKQRPLRFF